ncbi:MAG: ComF family protein [Elusimicrobia bacterium]|nr:ComF family protein [Elusimicrobiota bacterium]
MPATCVHCQKDLPARHGEPLCPTCLRELKPLAALLCRRCGVPLAAGGAHCSRCRRKRSFPCRRIRSAFLYEDRMASLIHAFKYRSRYYLARNLGEWMWSRWRSFPEIQEIDCVVPVPLHPKKERERGFNQSRLLAQEFCRHGPVTLRENLLARVRPTSAQVRLDRNKRAENVREAFCAAGELPSVRSVLLIDDVCTTGATLEACATALRGAGIRKVYAYTLARQV